MTKTQKIKKISKSTKSAKKKAEAIKETREASEKSKKQENIITPESKIDFDQASIATNLKKLLALGKSQDFLTYDQINQHIDSSSIDPERLEKIFDIFAEFKIQIVKKEEDIEKEEDKNENDEERILKKNEDSVKTYLKSMSNVQLLSKEKEIEIAIRIEKGRNKTIRALYESPMVMRYFIDWYNGLANGTILLRDIIRIDETYNSELEEILKSDNSNTEEEISSLEDELSSLEDSEDNDFDESEAEEFEDGVVSFVSMERILLPKMLEAFREISIKCQEILDKIDKTGLTKLTDNKEFQGLQESFNDLAKEVSFNDSLIKGLVDQLHEIHQNITKAEISLLKLSKEYNIPKKTFLSTMKELK